MYYVCIYWIIETSQQVYTFSKMIDNKQKFIAVHFYFTKFSFAIGYREMCVSILPHTAFLGSTNRQEVLSVIVGCKS